MHDRQPDREQHASDREALAATLRTGADLVESAARSVSPTGLAGWYVPPLSDYLVLGGGENRAPSVVARTKTPELAAFLALWSPLAGVTMAYMLRQVAHEIESYDECHRLPPPLARSFEKRAVWAGELAGHFLRSLNVRTSIPLIENPQHALAAAVEKLRGDVAELPPGIHAFARDVFAILNGADPATAIQIGGLRDTMPAGLVARMLECILHAWLPTAPITYTVSGSTEQHQVPDPDPAVQPLAGAAQRYVDGGYAR